MNITEKMQLGATLPFMILSGFCALGFHHKNNEILKD